jgi:hypothetical protein
MIHTRPIFGATQSQKVFRPLISVRKLRIDWRRHASAGTLRATGASKAFYDTATGVRILAHGEKDESQSRRRVLFNALVFCDA